MLYCYCHRVCLQTCGHLVGGGGGAGYTGGAGAEDGLSAHAASAGSSFLDVFARGKCVGLSGNSGDGYVVIQSQ